MTSHKLTLEFIEDGSEEFFKLSDWWNKFLRETIPSNRTLDEYIGMMEATSLITKLSLDNGMIERYQMMACLGPINSRICNILQTKFTKEDRLYFIKKIEEIRS